MSDLELQRNRIRLWVTIGIAFLLTAVLAVVAWELFPDITPEELQLCRQSGRFIEIYQKELRPEPRERNTFLLTLFASPFLAAAAIGVAYGTVSAMCGGRIDAFMMRVVDIAYSLPFTIFVILLTVAFGRSVWLIFAAIGAVEWLTMARIVRACALDIKNRAYVEAAFALGEGKAGVVLRHILPNAAPAILVCAALTVPSVMLLESFLSFLGLGVQAPLPSWGSLIKDGAEYMEDAPWMLAFPALFFSLTLFSLNRIGEALSRGGGE